jgi:hypothetical protein
MMARIDACLVQHADGGAPVSPLKLNMGFGKSCELHTRMDSWHTWSNAIFVEAATTETGKTQE